MLNLKNILSVLLLFVPISIAGHFLGWSDQFVFVTSALAIVPLAAWMGTATEEIAVVMGPALGGLLNATFGNATLPASLPFQYALCCLSFAHSLHSWELP